MKQSLSRRLTHGSSTQRRGRLWRALCPSLALLLALESCAINPVTKTPEISFMSLEEEKEAGAEAAKQIEENVGIVRDEKLVAYVQALGARLAVGSPRQDVTYTFQILDVDFPNAFALPGGYIYVSRGLLSLVNSEDELAGVIGHEIGHVAALHYSSRSWRSATVGVLSGLGTLAGAILGGPLGVLGIGMLGQIGGGGLLAAHSRDQENQADRIGQDLAFQAGWDPAAISEFLRALDRDTIQREKAVQEASFLDSHPINRERIETTRARAAELGTPATPANPRLDRTAFLRTLEGLVIGQDVRAGLFDEKQPNLFLQPDLGFRVRFPEGWSTVNAPSFVGASDGVVKVTVELQGPGDDLKKAAGEYFAKKSREQEEAKKAKDKKRIEPEFDRRKAGLRRIGKKRAGYVVEGTIQGGQVTVLQYWIDVKPNVYRMTCIMATEARATYLNDCRTTAASIAPIRRKERESAKQVTLQLAEAMPGESIEDFNDRVSNHWNVEQTAAANGLSLPYKLQAGQLVKYTRSQVYVPEAPAAEGAQTPAPEPEAEPDDEPSGT
jgi:predicted Zn-dependent protease